MIPGRQFSLCSMTCDVTSGPVPLRRTGPVVVLVAWWWDSPPLVLCAVVPWVLGLPTLSVQALQHSQDHALDGVHLFYWACWFRQGLENQFHGQKQSVYLLLRADVVRQLRVVTEYRIPVRWKHLFSLKLVIAAVTVLNCETVAGYVRPHATEVAFFLGPSDTGHG
ncbi:hypothetical protein N1851_015728 [Merluccius polli]|uniref:Uncharacterized protein n=1 Tax=Merluccius polli TaxID=89951 RepID=A0AA47MSI5_MERPO|nr:hypothetical protein N1851_015728 [Merluccius polli]